MCAKRKKIIKNINFSNGDICFPTIYLCPGRLPSFLSRMTCQADLSSLTCLGCSVWVVLCHLPVSCPSVAILAFLSCPSCPVPAGLFSNLDHSYPCPVVPPSCHVLVGTLCPVQAHLLSLTCQVNLSRLTCLSCLVPVSCPNSTVTVIPSWFSCLSCPILSIMFWPSCPLFPILTGLSRLYSTAVLSQPSCPGYPALAVVPLLSCPSCPAPALFLLSCPCCHFLAV